MLLPPAKFLELSRMPACLMKESRSEPREVSGIRLIWFHVKGMVIWQQNTYPISSTVVAKGLCQQDRKMKLLKLLLLPLAFGMATGFTKAFWESGQGYPGQVGNRNGSNHVRRHERNTQGKAASHWWGDACLSGLRGSGSESDGSLVAKQSAGNCLSRYCPSVTGSRQGHKTL